MWYYQITWYSSRKYIRLCALILFYQWIHGYINTHTLAPRIQQPHWLFQCQDFSSLYFGFNLWPVWGWKTKRVDSVTTPGPVLLCRDGQWWEMPPAEERQGCVFQPTNGTGVTSVPVPASSKQYMVHNPPRAQSLSCSCHQWSVGRGKLFLWKPRSERQHMCTMHSSKAILTFAPKTLFEATDWTPPHLAGSCFCCSFHAPPIQGGEIHHLHCVRSCRRCCFRPAKLPRTDKMLFKISLRNNNELWEITWRGQASFWIVSFTGFDAGHSQQRVWLQSLTPSLKRSF